MRKLVVSLLVATGFTAALTAQPTPTAAAVAAPAASADPVVLSSGSIEIRKSEFEAALQSLPPQYQQFALGPGKKQFAEEFLRMKLLAIEGAKAGLENDPEVIKQLATIRENLLASAQLKKMDAAITVAEADLRAAYDARKADFEKAKARHILVAFKGSPAAQSGKPELTEEQAKAKAEELRAKVEGGASFEAVAKSDSDDTGSGEQGGDLGEFGRGQMVPEFEQAAFTTEVGKLSPVFRTQYGFHFVKVDARNTTPFEQAKEGLERSLRGTKVQEAMKKLVDDAKPTFDEAYFGK